MTRPHPFVDENETTAPRILLHPFETPTVVAPASQVAALRAAIRQAATQHRSDGFDCSLDVEPTAIVLTRRLEPELLPDEDVLLVEEDAGDCGSQAAATQQTSEIPVAPIADDQPTVRIQTVSHAAGDTLATALLMGAAVVGGAIVGVLGALYLGK